MKKSIFYQRDHFVVPLSFGFLEELQFAVSEVPESADITLLAVVEKVLNSRFPEVKLGEGQQQALFQRLQDIFSDSSDDAEESPESVKSLGTALSEHFSHLPPADICLYLSGYDLDRASHLYQHEDRTVVMDMYNVKTELEMQKLTASFETSMYGFGGGYKDDPNVKSSDDGDADTVDLTKEGNSGAFDDLKSAFGG